MKAKLSRLWSAVAGIIWATALLRTVFRGFQGLKLAGLHWGVGTQYLAVALIGGFAVVTVFRRRRDVLMGIAFALCALQTLVISPFVILPALENAFGISYHSLITLPQLLWGCLYILIAVDCFVPRLPRWLRSGFLVLGVGIVATGLVADFMLFANSLNRDFWELGWKILLSTGYNAVVGGLPAVALGVAHFRVRD